MRHLLRTTLLAFFLAAFANGTFAQQGQRSFSDVHIDHPAFEAVEFLKANGIIDGYPDGTFKPERIVNRAEATKIIVAPKASKEALAQFTQTDFTDIPADAWYLPYVMAGRLAFAFIDGPPERPQFEGARAVNKVEFLKMLLIANGIDKNSYSEIKLPLADDVTNPDEWFYPYMRYAMTASMIMIGEDGRLHPGKELTRGDVALLMYRFLMYQDNRRTQALLSEAESEIIVLLNALDEDNLAQAEYASARALLASRGALASRPDAAIVKGALKVTEAFRSLVRAYHAGTEQDFEAVVQLAGEAYRLGDEAIALTPDLNSIAEQVKSSASQMADSARELLAR